MAKKINYAAMFTLRKDGRYQGSYTDARGRHYVYDRDPEMLFRKLQAMADQQEAPVTFRQIAEGWEREHREEITPRTWNNYEPHYKDILTRHGHKPLQAVTALDIMNHLTAAKTKGYGATVVNSIRSLYRMIFDYAVAQIKAIFAGADAPFGLFAVLLLCTGLRKSEALALQWSDVDLARKEISVTKSLDYTNGAAPKLKPPKTDAGVRTVPIIDLLYGKLLEARSRSNSLLLFPAQESTRGGKGGGLMTLRGYEGAWLRYCMAVGLMEDGKPAITAHNLRHGTATLMFELGVDELTAQRVLGHSRIEITREIYTDLRAAQNTKSINKFNKGMRKYMA